MTHDTIRVQTVEGEPGVLLPQELLDELGWQLGDTLCIVRTEHGLELFPCDRIAVEVFEVAREKHRGAFRRLAE